uniref:Uncharacterized protein n=1 Tax=Anguilla anguilla TaxID=7936 RepID=A0A0E9X8F7_ANGAN
MVTVDGRTRDRTVKSPVVQGRQAQKGRESLVSEVQTVYVCSNAMGETD